MRFSCADWDALSIHYNLSPHHSSPSPTRLSPQPSKKSSETSIWIRWVHSTLTSPRRSHHRMLKRDSSRRIVAQGTLVIWQVLPTLSKYWERTSGPNRFISSLCTASKSLRVALKRNSGGEAGGEARARLLPDSLSIYIQTGDHIVFSRRPLSNLESVWPGDWDSASQAFATALTGTLND